MYVQRLKGIFTIRCALKELRLEQALTNSNVNDEIAGFIEAC